MKYKRSINGFVEVMAGLVEQNASGHVVLISEAGDWGKVAIHNGEIHSIGLGDYRGPEVLDYLQPMESIQFMFRPAHGKALDELLQSPGTARMDNNKFFYFFDYVLPKVGLGTTPLATEESTQQAAVAKILVVDDSALARKVVMRHLITADFAVVEAKDGFEAIGQLEHEHPDLVILDLIMPGMDGYQVVDIMKASVQFQNIPIIMLTARDSLMDKLKGKMSASDAYITKPVKKDILLEKLYHLLQ
ncbi:MAG: response regulator [Pseudomonadota bacterium]